MQFSEYVYSIFQISAQSCSKIIAHFGPKTVILINFSKFSHRIMLFFLIETTFVIYITRIAQWKFCGKSILTIFGPFLTKKLLFWPKIDIWANFLLSAHRILLIFHIETIFEVFFFNYLVKVLTKVFLAHFLAKNLPFWLTNVHLDQFPTIFS